MRKIKYIVIHCTATSPAATVDAIKKHWRSLGWTNPGYHHIVKADGTINDLQPIEKPSNGVHGYNANSIHISYIGGIVDGKPADTRTSKQSLSILNLIGKYKEAYPNAVVLGHRDFSRDQNGNGIIERWEWIKECPCFDVRDWLRSLTLEKEVRPSGIVYKLNKPLIYDTKVKEIQHALNLHGVRNERGNLITEDRFFGAETDFAVKAFQNQKGLPITGIVDEATQTALGIKLIF